MRLENQNPEAVGDQRKSFMARFLEELKRAAVETLTPTGQQEENEREKDSVDQQEWLKYQLEVLSRAETPRAMQGWDGKRYDTLDEYINRRR